MRKSPAFSVPSRLAAALLLLVLLAVPASLRAELPVEPIEIQPGEPQLFVDDWIVDNRFAIKYKSNAVVHRLHPPVKHPDNPLIEDFNAHLTPVWDEEEQQFKLWYGVHSREDKEKGGKTNYAVAYADSKDGLEWNLPALNLFEWKGSKENNIVWRGLKQARASGQQILLSIPEEDKKGYRYIMTYRSGGAGKDLDGIRLIGSHDGIHWDETSDTQLRHLHSDTLNSIVYDSRHQQYLMTCRAKDRYRRFQGNVIDTGTSRYIARLTNTQLWSPWEGSPQTIILPDAVDASTNHNFFYGMPMHYHAGIYWGFCWVFRMNDPIHTELITSRDGAHWNRLPGHPALIPLGEEGAWDDGMTFGGTNWVEIGDKWYYYYGGYDGGHDSRERKGGLGLAVGRKEGFVSLHGPENGGGVVITRLLKWPGGELFLNIEAPEGEVRVRVSDQIRDPIESFNYDDCETFTGDAVSHQVTWKNGKSLNELKGREIRFEIFLQNADLYSFCAEEKDPS